MKKTNFLSIRKHRFSGYAGIFLGGFPVAWILVQVWVVGWVSWLQPLMLSIGALELALGLLLHKELAHEAK